MLTVGLKVKTGQPKVSITLNGMELRLDIDPSVKPDIVGNITEMPDVREASVDAVFSSPAGPIAPLDILYG